MFDGAKITVEEERRGSQFDFEIRPILNLDGSLPPIADVRFEVVVTLNSAFTPKCRGAWQGATQVVLDGMDVCKGSYKGLEFMDERTKRLFEKEAGTAVFEAHSCPGAFLRGFTA